ncbi:MAG: pyruvate, water dikinase regulatory protein [Anaerolineae bacterium]
MSASTPPTVFVLSGGTGASGELLVRTALAQFRGAVPVVIVPHVLNVAQVAEAVGQARDTRGIIAHTFVDGNLRRATAEIAAREGVVAVDLIGPLLEHLSALLGEQPAGKPGLYRQQREKYFERVEAIEFSVAHDDGQRIEELPQAEIVLVGVSRAGKTPLSMYLSVMGWKVANVPLVPEVPPPPVLLQVDPRRVVGLTIEPGQLIAHRRWRQQHLGIGVTSYTAAEAIYEEVETFRRFCRRHGFAIVDVTDKPIESSAEEVIAVVTRRLRGAEFSPPS